MPCSCCLPINNARLSNYGSTFEVSQSELPLRERLDALLCLEAQLPADLRQALGVERRLAIWRQYLATAEAAPRR